MSTNSSLAKTPVDKRPTDPFLGRALDGRYYLQRRIGAGGMGSVYQGEHVTLGTPFAIKVLSSGLASSDKNRRRFLHEARAAAAVRSPHVVQIYDYGVTSDGIVYFVMELLEGRDLSQLFKQAGPLSWARACHVLIQLARGLEAAHACGVIHRDVKPSNCFVLDELVDDGVPLVKLLDFGIAKCTEGAGSGGFTKTREILGTVGYIAPERIQGQSATAASDVYSMGALMYRMLVGHMPYHGKSAYQVFEQQVRQDPPHPRSIDPSIDPDAEAIVLRALARDPGDRFPDARTFRAALERLSTIPSRHWVAPRPLPRAAPAHQGEEEALARAEASTDDLATGHPEPRARGVADEATGVMRRHGSLAAGLAILFAIAGAMLWNPGSAESSEATDPSPPPDASPIETPRPVETATPTDPPTTAEDGIAGASDGPAAAFPLADEDVAAADDADPVDDPDTDSAADSAGGSIAESSVVDEATPGVMSVAMVAAPDTGTTDEVVVLDAPAAARVAPRRARSTRKRAGARADTGDRKAPTDASVQAKLQRMARARCEGGEGTMHVRSAIGGDGHVLSVQVSGPASPARDCVRDLVKAQAFPAGSARLTSFTIRF